MRLSLAERGEEPRCIVSIAVYARELDPKDETGRARRTRNYHVVLNFPLRALGPEADEAIATALRAAEATGILGIEPYKIEATVEYDDETAS